MSKSGLKRTVFLAVGFLLLGLIVLTRGMIIVELFMALRFVLIALPLILIIVLLVKMKNREESEESTDTSSTDGFVYGRSYEEIKDTRYRIATALEGYRSSSNTDVRRYAETALNQLKEITNMEYSVWNMRAVRNRHTISSVCDTLELVEKELLKAVDIELLNRLLSLDGNVSAPTSDSTNVRKLAIETALKRNRHVLGLCDDLVCRLEDYLSHELSPDAVESYLDAMQVVCDTLQFKVKR